MDPFHLIGVITVTLLAVLGLAFVVGTVVGVIDK